MTSPPPALASLPALLGNITLTPEQFSAILTAIQGAGSSATQKPSSRRHIAKPSTWNAIDGNPADWKLEVETFMRATDDDERIATILSYLADDARLWARPILKKDPECMVTIKDVPVAAWDSVEAFWAFFDTEWTSRDTVERAEADIIRLTRRTTRESSATSLACNRRSSGPSGPPITQQCGGSSAPTSTRTLSSIGFSAMEPTAKILSTRSSKTPAT
jgi:hypothetical protein